MPEGQNFLETTTQTVAWFRGRFRDEELELKPLFQRNPVWSTPQKSYLIDSILRGYPVPELYLQTVEDDAGVELHVVVDGQQRIRACLEFLDGRFALDQEGSAWDGCYFEDLSPQQKTSIRQYKFAVRVLPSLEEPLLREIFGRLNRNNMALNKQELRNATYWGAFIGCMQDLASDEFWVGKGLFTANDFRRMLDIEFVSELTVGLLFGEQNKKDSLDGVYEDFEEEFPSDSEVRSTFRRVYELLDRLVDWGSPDRWNKKSDFYTLFLYYASRLAANDADIGRLVQDKDKLREFSREVNEHLLGDLESDAPESVREYARAVQRAASDLQSRRVRRAALNSYLSGSVYTRPSGPRSAQVVVAQELPLGIDDVQEVGPEEEDS